MRSWIGLWTLICVAVTTLTSLDAHAAAQPPQTGQSACYDGSGTPVLCAETGQDGEVKGGIAWPSPRFVANNDQTVNDRLSGLVWTRDASAAGTPACPASGSPVTWQQALDHVKCLNADSFLGHSDWRLPNINDLRSLLHADQPNSASWLGILGVFDNVPTGPTQLFWSATTYATTPTAALGVKLGSSQPDKLIKTGTGYVWPVRGPEAGSAVQLPRTGQVICYDASGTSRTCTGSGEDGDTVSGTPWPIPRYLLNANQTVTDALTSLTWTQDANLMVTYDQIFDNDGIINDGAVSWDKALQFVKRLNTDQYKGFADWRLPNHLELLTLMDQSQASLSSALPAQGFIMGATPPTAWWSGTTNPGATTLAQAFTLQASDGSLFSTPKIANSWVWPVRGGSHGDAVISVTPPSVSFGTITTGTSAAMREIVLANTTSTQQTLVVDSITVEGADAAMFTVAPGGSTPCSSLAPRILPGANCTLSVSFTSPTLGSKSASVRILSNAVTGPVTTTLSGTTVDGTPPTGTVLINNGNLYTNSIGVNLTVSASDDTAGQVWMRFSNDLNSWSNWVLYDPAGPATSWNLAATDGLKNVYAQFKDDAGNLSLVVFDTIILKATPPAPVTISGLPASGTTNSQTLLLTVSGTDIVDYQYSLAPASPAGATITPAAGTWVPVTTQIRLDTLPEGSYALTVTGRDIAQNSQADPTIVTWLIDRTLPSLTVASVVSPTNVATPILSGTVELGIARVDVAIRTPSGATLTGAATVTGTAWTYPVPAQAFAAGTNVVTVTAFDVAGNSLSITTTIVYDTQPPTASISGVPAPNVATSSTTAILQVGGSEVVSYRYRLDGGTWSSETPVTNPITLANLASGPITSGNWHHTVNVIGRDLAGNWQSENSPSSYVWIVDTTPPAISISQPATPTSSSTVALQGTLDENATVTVRNVTTGASAPAQVNGLQWTVSMSLAVGINQFTATAVDTAGNSRSVSAIVEHDPTAPSALISTDFTTGDTITRNSVSFAIGGAGVVAYRYQITPATGFIPSPAVNSDQPVATVITLSPLPDATYTLSVQGVDAAGNVQVTPTTYTWTVDATPPTLAFLSGPANNSITSSDSATFAVNTATGVVVYKYAVDAASYPATEYDVNTTIDLTGLSEGVHTIFAIGRDINGNWQKTPTTVTWTVDRSAPALAITPPTNPTRTKSVSGTAEPGAVLTATIDGVTVASPASVTVPANGLWSYALTTITDGNHNVTITARDSANNVANSTVSINIDTVVPVVTVNGVGLPVSPATTGATSAVFTVTANETLDYYTWKIDTGSMSTAVPAGQPTQVNVANGPHTLTVDGYDMAGNKGTKTLTWTVNTTQPTVVATISGAPSGRTNATTANITIGGAGVNNYRYRWVAPTPGGVVSTPAQNDPAQSSLTPIAVTTMPEGYYILEVYGNDGAGNEQASPTVVSWVVDRTGPTATVGNVPASGYTNATTLNLTVAGTDVTTYRYRLVTVPGGAVATPTENAETPIATAIAFSTATGFPEGAYTLKVIGKDTAGNWQVDPSGTWWTDPAATTVTFTVDRTLPTFAITSPADNVTINANSQLFSGTATDTASPVTVKIYRSNLLVGTATPVAGVWSFTVQGLTTGANSIRIEAVDSAGNADSVTQTINLTTILPTAVLSGAPPAYTTSQNAAIVVTGANNVVAYRYRLDGAAFTPAAPGETVIATPISLAALAEGPHTLEVIGKDIAGNWQESPTVVTWTIDRTPPTATIVPATPVSPVNAPQLVFDVGGTDVVAYKYSIDNNPFSTSETLVKLPITLSGLATGPHSLRVIGRDQVGNWQAEASATEVTWVVVITPPQITVNPVSTPTAVTPAALSGSVTVNAATTLASFTVVNSTTNTPATPSVAGPAWSAADVSLTNGLNNITITATDTAGNVSRVVVTIELKSSPPTAVILSGAPPVQTNATGINLAIGGTGVVAYRYRLDGVDGDPYSAEQMVGTPLTLSSLVPGAHTLKIIGRDNAGNWQAEAAATTLLWVIDITPPTLRLTQLVTPTSNLVQTIRGEVEAGCTVSIAFDTAATGGAAIVIGTNWQFTTLNSPATGLQPGVNTLTIIATDPAGNRTTLGAAIEYDAVLPAATLTGTPPAVTRATGATLLVGGEGVVAYSYSLDNGGYSPYTSIATPIALTGLTDGTHTVSVLGRKQSGLVQVTPTTVTWTVDTTPPIAAIVSGRPAAQTQLQDLAVTVGGAGVVLYRYSLDGEPYSPETPVAIPISRIGLQVGAHILNIIGRDEAGNWQVVPTQVVWTIDITPPAAVLVAGLPTDPSSSNSLNLTISGADVAYYQYKLDGETFSDSVAVASPLLRTNIPDGTHTIAIRGVDLAGNIQVVPFTFTWTVDTVAPTTVASPRGGEYDNTITVTLTTSEPATIYYTTDGTTPTINSTIYTAPISIGKTTSLHFFARDLAGNLEPVREENYVFISNGDIDGDGRITVLDAMWAMRFVARIDTPTADQLKRADVAPLVASVAGFRPNPDGDITIQDVVVIMKLIVKILSW